MFVDVSNMTAREVQRLGHEDDEGPVQRQWTVTPQCRWWT
jgi:hypothetical protein